MAQMYMIEIFIDTVTIFTKANEDCALKQFIVKVRFGPTKQFIIKERELVVSDVVVKDAVMISADNDERQTCRSIKVGKSYLFPSYPDTMISTLKEYPLEIEVWNDEKDEKEIFVGIGYMHWHTDFVFMIKETFDSCKHVEPLSIKQVTSLQAECCCVKCGEVSLIVRMSPLGNGIVTEFQQLMKEPDKFVFRTDKAPSKFECQRVDGNPNYGPTRIVKQPEEPIEREVCTNIQSCVVEDKKSSKDFKKYKKDKIKMGEIKGPCGNIDCPLAHRVKKYIRNLDSYKTATKGKAIPTKKHLSQKVCGKCVCKDDHWHREHCLDTTRPDNICKQCGGYVAFDMTCDAVKKENRSACNSKDAPRDGITEVMYVFSVTSVPNYAQFNNEYVVQSMRDTTHKSLTNIMQQKSTTSLPLKECCCNKPPTQNRTPLIFPIDFSIKDKIQSSRVENNPLVYATEKVDTKAGTGQNVCKDSLDNKDCRCTPIIPQPLCKSVDCKCCIEATNKAMRKTHKPYCPSYQHKDSCEVTKSQLPEDEESKNTKNDEDDEKEKLPFGLPPIKLGPCMVIGRPCMVPDGFTRMHKTADLKPLPPSYSEAGKICCTKELERVKSVLKKYMVNEKDDDFRCVNKFLEDSEKRCCEDVQK